MTEDILSFKARLAMKVDPQLEAVADAIDIDNDNGVLTLSGTLPTSELAAAAEQTAISVAGVAGVNNNLTFEHDSESDDSKAQPKTAFDGIDGIGISYVRGVSTPPGSVTPGEVDNFVEQASTLVGGDAEVSNPRQAGN